MGLDAVELVLKVEDTFQIHISDEEAAKTMTVGALHNLVLSKLELQDSNRCLTSAAFYRTRRAITEVLGADRRSVTARTRLTTLLPLKKRRENWRRIQSATRLKVPDLEHSWLLVVSLGALLSAFPLFFHWLSFQWLSQLCLFVAGLIVSGVFLKRCLPALALSFPNSHKTVGELSTDILLSNTIRLSEEIGGIRQQDVWEVLRKIVVRQLGVKPEQVTRDARFVDDLHMD